MLSPNLSSSQSSTQFQRFPLVDLRKAYVVEEPSSHYWGCKCSSCDGNEWKDQRRRFVRSPEALVISIDRTPKTMTEPEQGTSVTTNISTVEATPLLNKVRISADLPVAILTAIGQLHTETEIAHEPGSYRLIRMLVHDANLAHWVTYVRLGHGNNGPFHCFDDFPPNCLPPKQATPWRTLVDADKSLIMLLYRKKVHLAPGIELSSTSHVISQGNIDDIVQYVSRQDY